MDHLVSVIITAYNIETYIERAIKSALSQTDVAIEVIVIDDCSTDNTFSIATTLQESRVQCIKMPKNFGPGAARNAGIALAKGQWIAVLDGDDAFAPERLTRCLKRAQETQADIIVDNLKICPENETVQLPMFLASYFDRLKEIDLATFIAGNSSFLGGYTLGYLKPVFSALFLKKHNVAYPTTIRIGEDYLFMAEMLANNAVCVVESSTNYFYTVRDTSISHRLSLADVTRIQQGDKIFLSRHQLNEKSKKAQKSREFHLKEAYAFTQLVDAIKQKKLSDTIKSVSSCPSSIRHLWRPLWSKIKKPVCPVSRETI